MQTVNIVPSSCLVLWLLWLCLMSAPLQHLISTFIGRKSTRSNKNLSPSIHHIFHYSQEPPESKIPQICPNWPQECTRLLPICTYLQYSRLRPRPRLRLSQEHPRIIIHSYPKQQPQTQNAQQTGNTSNSKVPKRRNIKTPFPFQKA